MGSSDQSPAGVRVLLSIPEPRSTTNPYSVMLADALNRTPGLEVRHFSWAAALGGDFDVFHLHWPDALPMGNGALRTVARHGLLSALIVRLKVRRTPIVRTLHNRRPHEDHHGVTRLLLKSLDRLTTATISLNPSTDPLPGVPNHIILLGELGSWYGAHPRRTPQRRHLVSFGAIRPYKNLEALVAALMDSEDPDLRLTIAGPASDRDLVTQLQRMAAEDPRVTVHAGFVADLALVDLITSSEMVVLPYRELHNSAALLTALGLDRPVLVPKNDVTEALAVEVGGDWVTCYEGTLNGATLTAALDGLNPQDAPNLEARGWDRVGVEHLYVYRSALAGVRSQSELP